MEANAEGRAFKTANTDLSLCSSWPAGFTNQNFQAISWSRVYPKKHHQVDKKQQVRNKNCALRVSRNYLSHHKLTKITQPMESRPKLLPFAEGPSASLQQPTEGHPRSRRCEARFCFRLVGVARCEQKATCGDVLSDQTVPANFFMYLFWLR